MITSEHFPAGLLDCGSESVIGNSRAVVTRQYPDRTEELRNTDYYDVQSGQGIVSEQIVLSAGVVNKACHLDGSTVFLDRGALTYGVSTAKFVFKGSVAIEDGAVKNMSEESEIVTLSSTDIRVSVTHSRQTNTYVLRKK